MPGATTAVSKIAEPAEGERPACRIAVIIPAYKVAAYVLDVIARMGPEVRQIYVVDDCCPEMSGKRVQEECADPRVTVLFHQSNKGVGGAMVTGYKQALADRADIVVKVDGDGQMDPRFIPLLVRPLIEGRGDYSKGNRFYTLDSLRTMPRIRVFGNAVLSFMAKLSTGYWTLFDPNNGYTAILGVVLAELPLDKISQRYFFETDMLFRLNTIQAVVVDVPMKAVYGAEPSNLKVSQVIFEFSWKHLVNFHKRFFYNYLLRNFSAFSIEFIVGTAMLIFATIFGLTNWYHYASRGVLAPTGVIMVAVLPFIVGLQFVLSFLHWDARNLPRDPLHHRL